MPFKIFYVDDEPDLLEIFSETFSGPDIEVLTFTDPNLAIREIHKNPPDLLFIDYRLGGITGDRVAQMLDKSIPKALVTGELNLKLEYNFDQIFHKPYSPEQITDFIQSKRVFG